MAAFKTFEEINAWQNSRVLVRDVYALTRCGDFCKDYGLKDQIQRAAVSICSNIAEGFERRGNKELTGWLIDGPNIPGRPFWVMRHRTPLLT